jgi:AraC family transcriptional regulator
MQRPEQVIARGWGEDPEKTASGVESGLSAALWHHRGQGTYEYRRPAFAKLHVLAIRLDPIVLERCSEGRWGGIEREPAGSAGLAPAGIAPHFVLHGACRVVQLYLPDQLLIETALQSGLMPGLAHRLDPQSLQDPVLARLGFAVAAEIERSDASTRLQLEALGTMLAVHLLRHAARAGPGFRPGGLAAWQVKRALACIAERLAEPLSLVSLAREVGLSPYHFARAFKHSTGLTPHRQLIHCRLRRAKHLLARSDASIADIAASVGYRDPTQLARLFQSEIGVSPSQYRRQVRS